MNHYLNYVLKVKTISIMKINSSIRAKTSFEIPKAFPFPETLAEYRKIKELDEINIKNKC